MEKLIEEMCFECKGGGYVQIPAISIFRVCKICGGTGRTDWISNINKTSHKKVDDQMRSKLFQNNIERLIYQIKEECFQATGMYAEVNIKMENQNLDRMYIGEEFYGKTLSKNKTIQI